MHWRNSRTVMPDAWPELGDGDALVACTLERWVRQHQPLAYDGLGAHYKPPPLPPAEQLHPRERKPRLQPSEPQWSVHLEFPGTTPSVPPVRQCALVWAYPNAGFVRCVGEALPGSPWCAHHANQFAGIRSHEAWRTR